MAPTSGSELSHNNSNDSGRVLAHALPPVSDSFLMSSPDAQQLWNAPPSSSGKARTRLIASVVRFEQRFKRFTEYVVYVVESKVLLDDVPERELVVWRRYSDFDKLYRALQSSGFQCPPLPGKQFFSFQTEAFIQARMQALHIWLQATVHLWQTATDLDPVCTYLVGIMFEAFLCDPDSETFSHSLGEIQADKLLSSKSTTPGPSTFYAAAASLPALVTDHGEGRSVTSSPINGEPSSAASSSSSGAQDIRPMYQHGRRKQGLRLRRLQTVNESSTTSLSSLEGGNSQNNLPTSASMMELSTAASDNSDRLSSSVPLATLDAWNESIPSSRGEKVTFASESSLAELSTSSASPASVPVQLTDEDHPLAVEKREAEAAQLEAAAAAAAAQLDPTTASEEEAESTDTALTPPLAGPSTEPVAEPAPASALIVEPRTSTAGESKHSVVWSDMVGVAIELRGAPTASSEETSPHRSGGSQQPKKKNEYATFDASGNKVLQSFEPFVATVRFSADPPREAINQSTPVSVPPTPHGQTEFNAAWNQYTNTVLNFVQERLAVVATAARTRNEGRGILDRHEPGASDPDQGAHVAASSRIHVTSPAQHTSHHHQQQTANPVSPAFQTNPKSKSLGNAPIWVRNLRRRSALTPGHKSSSVHDLTAAAGSSPGSTSSAPSPGDGKKGSEEARFISYVAMGEHLSRTILKESEAGGQIAGSVDWEFVSYTKDVWIMRRARPIKRRMLLARPAASPASATAPLPSSSPVKEAASLSPSIMANADFSLDPDAAKFASSPAFQLQKEQQRLQQQLDSFVSPPPQIAPPSSSSASCEQQYCFMGTGVLEFSAEQIYEVVRRPDMRHHYDSVLNEQILLENLMVGFAGKSPNSPSTPSSTEVGNLLVYYHLFETNRCFLRYTRDFCVFQYARKIDAFGSSGTSSGASSNGATPSGGFAAPHNALSQYVVVGASVDHPECPEREGVERAVLDLFGWVIESLSPTRSKVTYIMHIDFGNNGVPTHLLNTISFRQPLCVAYLRRYMESTRALQGSAIGAAAGPMPPMPAALATASGHHKVPVA